MYVDPQISIRCQSAIPLTLRKRVEPATSSSKKIYGGNNDVLNTIVKLSLVYTTWFHEYGNTTRYIYTMFHDTDAPCGITTTKQDAQLSQRDGATAAWVSFRRNISVREYSARNLIGLSLTILT